MWPRISGVNGVFKKMGDQIDKDNPSFKEEFQFFDQDKLDQLKERQVDTVRYLDGVFEKLYDMVPKNTHIIVTADHGELFGEQDRWGHGEFLSTHELSIPMIIKYPGHEVAPGRDARPMQQVDVMPLILERVGLPVPEGVQGRVAGRDHPLVSEVYPLPMFASTGDWRVLVDGSLKYVWSSQGRHALYDLDADPEELHDLSGERPEVMQAMHAKLERYLASLPAPGEAGPEREVDAATTEALQHLGYMDGDDSQE